MVLIIFPLPWKDCCIKRAFYTCVMKWFQPVCISAGETNKDNYFQQIPFYPPHRACPGRLSTLQPESIGLLGQSAPRFLCFYIYAAFSGSCYTQGLVTAVACGTKLRLSAVLSGRRRDTQERGKTAAVGERGGVLMCANSPTPAD